VDLLTSLLFRLRARRCDIATFLYPPRSAKRRPGSDTPNRGRVVLVMKRAMKVWRAGSGHDACWIRTNACSRPAKGKVEEDAPRRPSLYNVDLQHIPEDQHRSTQTRAPFIKRASTITISARLSSLGHISCSMGMAHPMFPGVYACHNYLHARKLSEVRHFRT
jgi:hypothetical protein